MSDSYCHIVPVTVVKRINMGSDKLKSFILLVLLKESLAKVSSGYIKTNEDWVYLDRFYIIPPQDNVTCELRFNSVRKNNLFTTF